MADRERPTRDPIYRLILGLMAADVAVGLVLTVVGEFMLKQRSVALAGLVLAMIGVLLLLFFRRLGARADRGSG
jgi:hypothetical protein